MAAKDTPLSKKLFPFFRLPRELRDNIYDFLPTGRRHIHTESTYQVWLGDRPMQHLLLVSKAFGNEYNERAQKKKHIRIQDTRSEGVEIKAFQLPAEAVAASSITFELACLNDGYDDDLERHIVVVKDIMSQMTAKPIVRIQLYFEVASRRNLAAKLKAAQRNSIRSLVELEGLASLEIFSYMKGWPMRAEIASRLLESYTVDSGECEDQELRDY